MTNELSRKEYADQMKAQFPIRPSERRSGKRYMYDPDPNEPNTDFSTPRRSFFALRCILSILLFFGFAVLSQTDTLPRLFQDTDICEILSKDSSLIPFHTDFSDWFDISESNRPIE